MYNKEFQCGCATICHHFPLRLQTVPFSTAANTHCRVIKTGALADIYTANKLLTAYGKCSTLENVYHLFDGMPHRDTVSWNAMITASVDQGDYIGAVEILKTMKRNGYGSDQYTFGSILKCVATLNCVRLGQQLHSMIVKMGLDSNVFSASALVDMYAKCDMVHHAGKVFENMIQRNVVSWNAMIGGYAQAGDSVAAFRLLNCMGSTGIEVDEATIASLLTLLNDSKFFNLTLQIHARIVKCGLTSKTIVCNALIAAYSECGSIESSEELFHGIGNNGDLVTWNSMLAAYVRNNRGIRAVELFIKMKRLSIKPDMYTCSTVVSACFEQEQHKHGKALHGLVTKTGMEFAISVSNSLIAMYIKSGDKCMTEAIRYFNFMDVKDSVSWNSILTGFSQNELSTEALQLFALMRFRYVEINQYSLSSILRSCSDLSILQLGQQIHGLAFKLGLEQNDFVSSSLMFMYSKCGVIEDAEKSFTETNKDSSISWNSIIFGYAQHGQGKRALHLFSEMQESGVKPDHITFVGVMSACSHIGLVHEGLRFLQSMEHSYGVPPRLEHYACAIDLLGRAGHLGEAKDLVDSMPMEPDAMVWKSLLGACRISGNVEIAAYAATYLEKLEPQEHSTYLILSDLYARFGRWNERAMVKRVMRDKGLKKVPGWSWIEVHNRIHIFNAEDQSHPQIDEIYERLEELMVEIGKWGYVAALDCDYEEGDYG